MVAKRSDYTSDAVEAARSVLLELSRLLGEYQKGIVIVGGWVPELLIQSGIATAYRQPGCRPLVFQHIFPFYKAAAHSSFE